MHDVAGRQEPSRDCMRCERLAAFRAANRAREREWHNAPVASFGPEDAALLIVGLAPGLRGANRTGRPFTGDGAGELLYPMLLEHGLAVGTYRADPADGLALAGCRITNSVRCVPPENKPTPAEIAACRPYLEGTIAAMPRLGALLALSRIAHESVLVALGKRRAAFPFKHGARHEMRPGLVLFDCFHCSRYNLNTGRLTPAMFRAVLADIQAWLAAQDQSRSSG